MTNKTWLVALLIVGLTFGLSAQPANDSEGLIVPGQGFGKYRAELGAAGLRQLMEEGELGEDEMGGLGLFFMQPDRRVFVTVDATGRVRTMTLHGSQSIWHTADGITLGSGLRDLEKANGQPFDFRSFEGEDGGKVVDWRGGKLQGIGIVFASPFRASSYDSLSGDEKMALENPSVLSSADPLAAKLNPVVETLQLEFP